MNIRCYFKNVLLMIFGSSMLAQLSACSQSVQWKEDVQLLDGRVITVTQKKRCEGGDYAAKHDASCVARESWLTLTLPEFFEKEIVWHERLDPMIVNIYKGKLYVVGTPPHTLEFRAYGAVNPPYYGFLWLSNKWQRIPFGEIPLEIYDANMLFESIPSERTDWLTLRSKNGSMANGDPRYPKQIRRIDPNYKLNAY